MPSLKDRYKEPFSEAADDNPVTVRFHCRGNCCDHHEWCRFWASVGECKLYRGKIGCICLNC
ncbi:unnamed protein product [Cylicostephanus goldi]|uniref:Uncharacterized protein n=1 Tax=Cylicostephanus goldi TaxID=71465 RepID=A0A3P7N1I3_CYLGO|nr:unnamed protein product [Cylicostephanus goldi]